MDADGMTLASYYGQCQRVGRMSVGDALTGLYRDHKMAVSIALCRTGGPRLAHRLRARLNPAQPGDLPLTVTAVGSEPQIEAVLGRTLELNRPGLVTVARARLLSGEIVPVSICDPAGQATKLTVYLTGQDRVYMVPAFEVICQVLHRRGLTGASVLRGADGSLGGRRVDAPVMVVAVGSGDQIGRVLPELGDLLRNPVLSLEHVQLCKRDGRLIDRPENGQPMAGEDGHWLQLTVYTSYTSLVARYRDEPLHRAVVRRASLAGVRGITAHRGIWGFRGDQLPYGDRSHRRGRHVPVVVTITDTAGRIREVFDTVQEMTSEHGLVTCETVTAVGVTSTSRRDLTAN